MKKYGALIGLACLALIELIFYLNGGRDNLETFFFVWSIVWLAMILFGLFNTFQKGGTYNTASPMGHPNDFLINSQLKTKGNVTKNSLTTVFLLVFLFGLNLLGYLIFM